jgi:hypothetical protein
MRVEERNKEKDAYLHKLVTTQSHVGWQAMEPNQNNRNDVSLFFFSSAFSLNRLL